MRKRAEGAVVSHQCGGPPPNRPLRLVYTLRSRIACLDILDILFGYLDISVQTCKLTCSSFESKTYIHPFGTDLQQLNDGRWVCMIACLIWGHAHSTHTHTCCHVSSSKIPLQPTYSWLYFTLVIFFRTRTSRAFQKQASKPPKVSEWRTILPQQLNLLFPYQKKTPQWSMVVLKNKVKVPSTER